MIKIKMIVKALEHYGNYNYNINGYTGAVKYWDLAKEIGELFNIYGLSNDKTKEDIKQLTVKDLLIAIAELENTMETEDILNMPVYIGDDDELNGIHCAWFRQVVSAGNEEEADLVYLIEENIGQNKFKGKAFLIS